MKAYGRRRFGRDRPLQIGITGSVGMGKSMIAGMLRAMGYAVHDSDAAVHEMFKPGHAVNARICAVFPQACEVRTGVVNRRILGEIVFHDSVQRRRLESILHPAVWESQARFTTAARRSGRKIVFFDIPLLYETGAEKKLDAVICVDAPVCIQRRRVLARPGMTQARFQAILGSQMPNREKCDRADFVVPTGAGRAASWRALRRIVKRIREG